MFSRASCTSKNSRKEDLLNESWARAGSKAKRKVSDQKQVRPSFSASCVRNLMGPFSSGKHADWFFRPSSITRASLALYADVKNKAFTQHIAMM